MRHRKAGRKLGRNSSHRKAMFRNMVTSLLRHDQIRTTLPKAKELRQWVEPVITLASKHAWSGYEGLASELTATLNSLESVCTSDEAKAAYQAVQQSNAKVSARFPSGLGRLSKVLQEMGDEVSEQRTVVLRSREAQMARQHALSQARSTVADSEVLEKLFGELAELFKERKGGYTRVIRAGHREGDNADMAYICLVLEALSATDTPEEVKQAEDTSETVEETAEDNAEETAEDEAAE